jgi:hypothetical protein
MEAVCLQLMLAMNGVRMSIAFSIVLNALLLAAMAFFLVALAAVVLATPEPLERLLRAAAAFAGALVVLGAQASGISYANFIVKSLEHNKTVGIGFLAAGLPALAGVGIGWYFVHSMKRSSDLTIRLLTFIGMLAMASFASIYVVGLSKHGADLGRAAIPNVSFAVALLLYVILKIEVGSPSKRRAQSSGNAISRLMARFNQTDTTPSSNDKSRLR